MAYEGVSGRGKKTFSGVVYVVWDEKDIFTWVRVLKSLKMGGDLLGGYARG